MSDELPPLRYELREKGHYHVIDELVPGLIQAGSAVQFGEPVVPGTRLPTSATWVWEYRDRIEDLGYADGLVTRDHIIAAVAFAAGVEWQRSRKRRKRMDEEVKKLWAWIREHESAEYEPGDETV